MNTFTKWLRRSAFALALAPLAVAAFAGPAQAYDHDRGRDRHWDHRDHYRGGYYAAPPPPVYYAPVQRAPSPGINLFFGIR